MDIKPTDHVLDVEQSTEMMEEVNVNDLDDVRESSALFIITALFILILLFISMLFYGLPTDNLLSKATNSSHTIYSIDVGKSLVSLILIVSAVIFLLDYEKWRTKKCR